MSGTFVISLDFELLWGVRDHATRQSYGANILGGREAIPRMLDLFVAHGIRATWATVGMVFCGDRDELFAALPPEEQRPRYANPALSSYSYLADVGRNETEDPWYFGRSLVRRIATTPGQEIATHTFSHCYCLEDGFTTAALEADLAAAQAVAATAGISLGSIVFPRNQYAAGHLETCCRMGLKAFRGNPPSWAYQATEGRGQTRLRRGLRLLDAHSGLLGSHVAKVSQVNSMVNVSASHFLRPCAGRLARFHPLHIETICRGMARAARGGGTYHLWWHPHNFGARTEDNLAGLQRVLDSFSRLRSEEGFRSCAIADFG